MASRIKELKDTLLQQNEMILTLRREKTETREVMTQLYTNLVKYKTEYNGSSTAVETSQYPNLRNEDAVSASVAELLRSTGKAIQALVNSVAETRGEIRTIYKELDQEVDDAMNQWNQIKLQESNDKKASLFREDIAQKASAKRAETPDNLVANGAVAGGSLAVPPTPPDSTGKAHPESPIEADIPKTGTTTLKDMLSPSPATNKHAKSIPQKFASRK